MCKANSLIMATRLKQLREERKLSHVSLSAALKRDYGIDISRDSLMSYEVSDPNHSKVYKNEGMRVEYLRCLSDFYNVSSDYLLGLTNDRSKNPAAVDELGLTQQSVSKIQMISKDRDCLNVLNMILESSSMFKIIDTLKIIEKAIKAEIDYTQQIITSGAYIESKDDPTFRVSVSELGTLGLFLTSEMIEENLTNELVTAHPEIKDRIMVVYGYDAIERRIDDLGNKFAFLIKEEMGFHDLTKKQFELSKMYTKERSGVSNGNN